jgi:hypothetical protein
MEQEKAFLNALEATAAWKIAGNNLEMKSCWM